MNTYVRGCIGEKHSNPRLHAREKLPAFHPPRKTDGWGRKGRWRVLVCVRVCTGEGRRKQEAEMCRTYQGAVFSLLPVRYPKQHFPLSVLLCACEGVSDWNLDFAAADTLPPHQRKPANDGGAENVHPRNTSTEPDGLFVRPLSQANMHY